MCAKCPHFIFLHVGLEGVTFRIICGERYLLLPTPKTKKSNWEMVGLFSLSLAQEVSIKGPESDVSPNTISTSYKSISKVGDGSYKIGVCSKRQLPNYIRFRALKSPLFQNQRFERIYLDSCDTEILTGNEFPAIVTFNLLK